MEYGWAESAPRLRSRLPNLNLLPIELLPTPLPWLTAGLALFAFGLLMLLYALFYMKSYTDLELQALRTRLAEDQEVARQLGLPAEALGPGAAALPPGTLEDWAELRARQVDWSAVFATLAAGLGPSVQVTGLSQAGYTVSVSGEAATAAEANTFLQRLRDSGLFASLEMSITGLEGPGAGVQPTAGPATAPTPVATAALQPTPLAPQVVQPTPQVKPGGVAPVAVPPVVAPPAVVQPAVPPAQPAPARPAAQPPPQPSPTLAPRTPLASPSPVGSPAAPAAATTPLPQTDWVVQAKRETVFPDRTAPFSHIRVRAVDADGTLMPGLRVRVESEGSPAWSDELPHADHPASDGTFELGVAMGKFTVFMLNGSSERATGLFTGVADQPGVHEWDLTFRKQTPGTPPAGPTCPGCSPTPTPTPTLTVAPTATPISVGRNLASLACVSASHNAADARKAVDGDVGTAWDSGSGPVVNITFDFRYPTNCDTTRLKPADQRTVQVEALELVTNMSARSRQTHEIWTIYDTGTAQLEYTFADVDVADNTTISAKFAAPRNIQVLQIRTIRSGVNVGWREVRLFEPLAPPFGSVPTGTSTVSPTPTPTVPASRLSFASAQASSENPGNPAVLAIDSNPDTFWRPVANAPAGQYLQLNFSVPQTVQTVRFATAMGAAIATATATVGPNTPTATPAGTSFRVSLLRPTTAQAERPAQDNDCYAYFVSADQATVQFDCSQPFTGVTGVRIYLDSVGNPAVPPGIREVSAYPPGQTPTPTFTPTRTPTAGTATPTPTPTRTLTPVGTTSPTASPTDTPSPSATPTVTRTPTPQEAATNYNDVTASDSDPANPPRNAVDAPPGSGQDPNTWWQTRNGVGVGPGQSAAWWEINFIQPLNVTRIETKLFMSRSATGTLTFELFDQSNGLIRSDNVVSSAPLDNQVTQSKPYAAPVAGVDRIRIAFSDLDQTGGVGPVVGLRTVYVFYTPSTSALAAFLSPLDRLLNVLAVRPAYAGPLEQTLPPAQAQVKPGAPAQPTQVVIGTPQQANAQLPPNPVPGQPLPAGRVSFLIVAQVRPGAP